MAEAVMFAMIWSFILSRTLVPTMAKYLLQPHVHHAEGEGPPPSRNPLVRFQRGFEAGFERIRGGYRGLLSMALARRPIFVDRLSRLRRGFVPAGAVSRAQLLSVGRCRLDPDACPHPGRHPRRGNRQPVRRHPEGDPQDHSAGRDRDDGRQYRHADQRHQHDLQQYRRDRSAGRRRPDQAEGRPPADRGLCQGTCASSCRGSFRA